MKRLWELIEESTIKKLSSGRYQQIFVTMSVFIVWGIAALIRAIKAPDQPLVDLPFGLITALGIYIGIGAYKRKVEADSATEMTEIVGEKEEGEKE